MRVERERSPKFKRISGMIGCRMSSKRPIHSMPRQSQARRIQPGGLKVKWLATFAQKYLRVTISMAPRYAFDSSRYVILALIAHPYELYLKCAHYFREPKPSHHSKFKMENLLAIGHCSLCKQQDL